MQVIDTAMVGRLGATQLGAVGFAGLVIWNCFVLFAGTASGAQAVRVALRRRERAAALRAVDLAGGLAGRPGDDGLDGRARLPVPADRRLRRALARDAARGDRVRLGATRSADPGWRSTSSLFAFFRGIGDTRTPLVVTLIAVSVHLGVRLRADLRALRHAGLGRRWGPAWRSRSRAGCTRRSCSTRVLPSRRCAPATTRGRPGRGSPRWRASCARARRSAASGCST